MASKKYIKNNFFLRHLGVQIFKKNNNNFYYLKRILGKKILIFRVNFKTILPLLLDTP